MQCMSHILKGAPRFCVEGVISQDVFQVRRHFVLRLAGYICDRMEAETICDCRSQMCFNCFRAVNQNWIPGKQPGDGQRFFSEVQTDITQAKSTGTWTQRPGVAAPKRPIPKPFWDPATLGPKPKCKRHLEEACKALRITQQSFDDNAFSVVPYFDLYQQIGYDSLHGGPLGVWPHLVKATLYTYKQHLFRWTDADGVCILGEAHWQAVLVRIQNRLAAIGVDCRSTTVSPFLTEMAKRADADTENPGKSSTGVRATEQTLLSLTIPYCFVDLIAPEIQFIIDFYSDEAGQEALRGCLKRHRRLSRKDTTNDDNLNDPDAFSDDDSYSDDDELDPQAKGAARAKARRDFLQDVHTPIDPSDTLVSILFKYVEICNQFRTTSTTQLRLTLLQAKVVQWKTKVLLHMPFKSGQLKGWSFIKWHYLDHATDWISWVGCMDNLSSQTPELCHQAYVKTLGKMINRHPDWANQAMLRWSHKNLADLLFDGGKPPLARNARLPFPHHALMRVASLAALPGSASG